MSTWNVVMTIVGVSCGLLCRVRDFVYLHPPQYLMSAQEYQTLWTEVNQGADGSIEVN